MLFSCSSPGVCPEFSYNPDDKITSLNEEPYTGRCSVLNEDGGVRSIQQYLNGYDYGKWTFYYSNGNIETKGKFINGKRAGTWKYFIQMANVNKYLNIQKMEREKVSGVYMIV